MSLRSEDLSDNVASLELAINCKEVWVRSKNVCSAINRLEQNGLLLPEPIVPLVRHFATCDDCKAEFAFMHKRCSFVLQECEHGDGFLSAHGCVHFSAISEEGAK